MKRRITYFMEFFTVKNLLSTLISLSFLAASSIAQAAPIPTQITEADCSRLSVRIGGYMDAEALFLALPEKSESISDSALERSLELKTQHDSLRIACALSSGERGVCSLVYRQDSATTDSCFRLPDVYFLSTEMSKQITSSLVLNRDIYRTLDRVLKINCAHDSSAGVGCSLDISY